MNLHQRIAAYDKKLTKTERRVVEDMLARYPQGLLESATALARTVGTSASTVVRLLAKLGYDSYAQAQTQARAELTARLASPGNGPTRSASTIRRRRPVCAMPCCTTSTTWKRLSPRSTRRRSRPRCGF